MPISAYHGLGLREVLERVTDLLPESAAEAPVDELRLAVVGRPNVGKSALVNAILGQDRVIVSEEAGTTRDAVDTPFLYRDQPLVLIDTAGIRRRGRVERGVEKYSVMRARQAIERCDVAVLVIDASEKLAAAGPARGRLRRGRHQGNDRRGQQMGPDGGQRREPRGLRAKVLRRLRFTPWAPLAFVSAKDGLNIDGLLELAIEIGETRSQRIPTAEVNAALREAVANEPAAARRGSGRCASSTPRRRRCGRPLSSSSPTTRACYTSPTGDTLRTCCAGALDSRARR